MLVSYGARTARKSKRINQRMHLNLTVKRSSFLEMDLLIQVSESDDFDDITSIH